MMKLRNGRSWIPKNNTLTASPEPTPALKCHLGLNFLNVNMVGIKWATSRENLFTPYVNNKGSDQTVHPHSLISNFVVRCFDSITPIVPKTKVSNLSLVSVAEQIGLSLTWSSTTEDRFSRDEAQIKQVLMRALTLSLLTVSRVLGV